MIKIVLFRYGIVSNVTSAGHICIISNVISAIKKIVYITIVKKIPKITYYLKKVWPENNKPSIIPIPWMRYCVLFCVFYFLLLGLQEDKVEQWERQCNSWENKHHGQQIFVGACASFSAWTEPCSPIKSNMGSREYSGICDRKTDGRDQVNRACFVLVVSWYPGSVYVWLRLRKHSKCFIRVLLQKQKCFVRQSNRRAPFYRP